MTNSSPLRLKSQRIFGLLIGLLLIDVLSFVWLGDSVGFVIFAAALGIPSWLTVQLRCPNCKIRLTKMFGAGSLFLLFIAKEKCRNCGHDLP
jgi:hypothetical protein